MNLKISWPMSEKSRLAQYITWLEKRIAIESDKPCLSDEGATNAAVTRAACCSYIELCQEWWQKESLLMSIFEQRGLKMETPLKLVDMWLTACSIRCTDDALRKLDAIAIKAISPYWRCQTITFDGTVVFEKLGEDSKAIAGQGIQCSYISDMQSHDGVMVDEGWLRVYLERCKGAFPATRYDGEGSTAQYYIEFGKFLSDKESLRELSDVISKYVKERDRLDRWTERVYEEIKKRKDTDKVEYNA